MSAPVAPDARTDTDIALSAAMAAGRFAALLAEEPASADAIQAAIAPIMEAARRLLARGDQP